MTSKMKMAPLKDTPSAVRVDVGRVYFGFDRRGFVNMPNDTIEEFGGRDNLHAWLDAQLDAAEERLKEREVSERKPAHASS